MPILGQSSIDKMKADSDIKGLVRAINNTNDPKARREAVAALCALKDYRALDSFLSLTKDGDPYVRQAATAALGAVGDSRTVNPLINLLQDAQWDVRRAAVGSLGQVCLRLEDPTRGQGLIVARPEDVDMHDKAVQSMVLALKQYDSKVRYEAASALSLIGWQPQRDDVWADYWVAKSQWSACVILGKPAVGSLLNLLKDWDPAFRQTALDTLGTIGEASTVKAIIDCFLDTDPGVRDSALDALHKMEGDGYDALMESIREDKSNLEKRSVCVEAMMHIGDYEHVVELINYLAHPPFSPGNLLQQAALQALGDRGDVHAARFLLQVYKAWGERLSEKSQLFNYVSERLNQIEDPMTIKVWVEVLSDRYHPFHDLAIVQLGELGTTVQDPLLHDKAVDALLAYRAGQTGPLRHSSTLALQRLGWTPGYVSRSADQPMPKTGPLQPEQERIAPFVSFEEENQHKWEDAGEVAYLANIGDSGAITLLGDALRRGNLKVHMAAARALAKIGTEQAMSELIDGLEETEDWIKVAHVAEVLGETLNPIAIIPLTEKLAHPEYSVRRAAAQSLVVIYRNGKLSDEQKQTILDERGRISQPYESKPDPKDPSKQLSTGIGIRF